MMMVIIMITSRMILIIYFYDHGYYHYYDGSGYDCGYDYDDDCYHDDQAPQQSDQLIALDAY